MATGKNVYVVAGLKLVTPLQRSTFFAIIVALFWVVISLLSIMRTTATASFFLLLLFGLPESIAVFFGTLYGAERRNYLLGLLMIPSLTLIFTYFIALFVNLSTRSSSGEGAGLALFLILLISWIPALVIGFIINYFYKRMAGENSFREMHSIKSKPISMLFNIIWLIFIIFWLTMAFLKDAKEMIVISIVVGALIFVYHFYLKRRKIA